MKTDDIYIGYTKEFEEVLVKKDGDFYIDLIKNVIIFKDEMYENLLTPFSSIDPTGRERLLFKIKKLYEKDRKKMLDVGKLYIGDIYLVEKILSKKYSGVDLSTYRLDVEYQGIVVEKNALLLRDDSASIFTNVRNQLEVDAGAIGIKIGQYKTALESLTPLAKVLEPHEVSPVINKKYALEKCYKKYKKEVR